MKSPKTVYILNKTEEEFRDRFDGEDYVFPPNQFVQVPVEAAKLIFGFMEQDKLRAIRRLGWAITAAELEKAKNRLKGFQFHMEPPNTVHHTAPVGVSIPSPVSEATNGGEGSGEGGDTDHNGSEGEPDLKPSEKPTKPLLNKLAATASRG